MWEVEEHGWVHTFFLQSKFAADRVGSFYFPGELQPLEIEEVGEERKGSGRERKMTTKGENGKGERTRGRKKKTAGKSPRLVCERIRLVWLRAKRQVKDGEQLP